jgi:hypothetical protein
MTAGVDAPSTTVEQAHGLVAWKIRQRNIQRRKRRYLSVGSVVMTGAFLLSPLRDAVIERSALLVVSIGLLASPTIVAPEAPAATTLATARSADQLEQNVLSSWVESSATKTVLPLPPTGFDDVPLPASSASLPTRPLPVTAKVDRPVIEASGNATKPLARAPQPAFAPFDLDAVYKDR